MRGAAICWVALAAGCGFEGGEGIPLDLGEGPPAAPLPVGTARITGRISSPELLGSFGAALMPAGAQLPAANPCFPKGTRNGGTPSALDRSFAFESVAPGDYTLVVFRAVGQPDELERTMKAITVSGTETDVGTIELPRSIDSDRESDDGGKVMWSAPALTAGVLGYAYELRPPPRGERLSACSSGTTLDVAGTFWASVGMRTDVRVVIESPLAGQMALKYIEAEDDDGGRRPR